MAEIISIEKKGGLEKLKSYGEKGRVQPLSPKLFEQKGMRDPDSKGDLIGDYKGKTIPDSRHFLAPYFVGSEWAWGSTPEKFNEIVKRLDLKYWKGHKFEGSPIPFKDFKDRVRNRVDDVFQHPMFYGKYFMENGHKNLNTADPVEEFLAYCYLGYKKGASNKSDNSPKNKYIEAGTRYEITNNKTETKLKTATLDKQTEAMYWLRLLKGEEDRLRLICEIMNLSSYDKKTTDVNGAYALLGDAAQDIKVSNKYNGKTPQERFTELAQEKTEQLELMRNVMIARSKGFIQLRKQSMIIDGETIPGLFNDSKMIDFILDPKNQEIYSKLLKFIEYA
jgi:hypothetical protein